MSIDETPEAEPVPTFDQIETTHELIKRAEGLIRLYEEAGVPDDEHSAERVTYNSLVSHRDHLRESIGNPAS